MKLPTPFRLLRSGPGTPPAWNMALDEALLEGHREGDPPLLRLYRWSPAGLSVGRFQPVAGVEVPPEATLVRRLSGGSAIHHRSDELTYSLVAPYRLFGGLDPRRAYQAIHAALQAGLTRLGVPAGDRAGGPGVAGRHGMCYATATDYDLVVGGRKLIGSAQRRRGRCFLQHGSLPFSPDPRIPAATSLAELLDPLPSPEAVEEALLAGFGGLASSWIHDAVREQEADRARALVAERYGHASWTHSR